MPSRSKAKARIIPDADERPTLSQQSSDDGVAAALIQQMNVTVEKRRKEKEARFLAKYQKETAETNARGALEFNDYCDQIDQVFDEFLIAYAKAEDKIRATWTEIIAAHAPFAACIREHLAAEIQQEKEREDQQLLGIAYHKKSDESLDHIIAGLLNDDA